MPCAPASPPSSSSARSDGARRVGAGNYGGKLGPFHFHLKELAAVTLVLTLKAQPPQRLDLSPLVPHLLDGKSAKEIAAIDLATTKDRSKVGDIFRIRAGGADEIRFEGGSERFDNVGRGLDRAAASSLDGDAGSNRRPQARRRRSDRAGTCRALCRLRPGERPAGDQGRCRRLSRRAARRRDARA